MTERQGQFPPCCLANGLTEGEHDADCDDHPGNQRARFGPRFEPEHLEPLIQRESA